MTTQIFSDNGFLNFSMGRLASREEFENCPRDVGTIFEALEPGEQVEVAEGVFALDDDLDLFKVQVYISIDGDGYGDTESPSPGYHFIVSPGIPESLWDTELGDIVDECRLMLPLNKREEDLISIKSLLKKEGLFAFELVE